MPLANPPSHTQSRGARPGHRSSDAAMQNDGGANAADAVADRNQSPSDDGDAEQPEEAGDREEADPARPPQEPAAANAAGPADAGRAQRAAPPPASRGRAQQPPAVNEDPARRSLRARAQVQPAAPPPPPAARGRGAPRGGGRASAQPSFAARGRPRGSVSDRLGPRAQLTRVEASVGAGDPWTRSDPPPGDGGAADQADEDMAEDDAVVVEASPPKASSQCAGRARRACRRTRWCVIEQRQGQPPPRSALSVGS